MTRARAIFTALLAVAAFATAIAAPDDTKIFIPGSSAAAAAAPVTGPNLGSVTLLVGLALAGVGAWLVWRARSGVAAGRDTHQLAIQETRSLGNRQYLVVATYEDKKFLLGVCPGRIDLLAPLHGEEPRV